MTTDNTYDEWEREHVCGGCARCGYPEREEPREVPEPDWDDIRESRREARELRED